MFISNRKRRSNCSRTWYFIQHWKSGYLLKFKDGRYAQHPRFRYFIFNMLQRHISALATTRIFVKQAGDEAQISVEELSNLATSSSEVLLSLTMLCNKPPRYSSLEGTKARRTA
eukprot:GHVR01059061.1.p1 GENE.GHVR01059061.1~~GHVR01059061.1.p1  ORF type:complete len:114 (-),score=2.21 GHVR01059061.1:694-1035(-)